MQKATTQPSSSVMIVTVSRFGSQPLQLTVPVGSTVSDVLATAGIALEGRQELYVEGTRADAEDVLENGDILSVVTPKQAGTL